MKTSNQLSPATIYFFTLSSVIHATLLRQLSDTFNPSPGILFQSDQERASWTKLTESSRSHLLILSRIRDDTENSTIDLIHAVEDILQGTLSAVTTSSKDWDVDMSTLRLYRWTKRGRGIVKLSPRIADEISKVEVGDLKTSMSSAMADLRNTTYDESVKRAILASLAPELERA
jgi:hypothetical protein